MLDNGNIDRNSCRFIDKNVLKTNTSSYRTYRCWCGCYYSGYKLVRCKRENKHKRLYNQK